MSRGSRGRTSADEEVGPADPSHREPRGYGEDPPTDGSPGERKRDEEIVDAHQEAVEEGKTRLERTWPSLLATGFIGGIDVSLGILGLLVVQEATGMRVLGALAFTIGFIALLLGRSELFTENFLVPVAAVVAGRSRLRDLFRLWAGTAFMNLLGGWVFAWVLMGAVPHLEATATEGARHYLDLGIGWEAFALGVLAGVAITVMTWMEGSSETELGRLAAAVSVAFLLAAVPLNHVIVVSLEIFAAIHAGADIAYASWAATAAWAALANLAGGLVLVTVLRLVQVGRAATEGGYPWGWVWRGPGRRPADRGRGD